MRVAGNLFINLSVLLLVVTAKKSSKSRSKKKIYVLYAYILYKKTYNYIMIIKYIYLEGTYMQDGGKNKD